MRSFCVVSCLPCSWRGPPPSGARRRTRRSASPRSSCGAMTAPAPGPALTRCAPAGSSAPRTAPNSSALACSALPHPRAQPRRAFPPPRRARPSRPAARRPATPTRRRGLQRARCQRCPGGMLGVARPLLPGLAGGLGLRPGRRVVPGERRTRARLRRARLRDAGLGDTDSGTRDGQPPRLPPGRGWTPAAAMGRGHRTHKRRWTHGATVAATERPETRLLASTPTPTPSRSAAAARPTRTTASRTAVTTAISATR